MFFLFWRSGKPWDLNRLFCSRGVEAWHLSGELLSRPQQDFEPAGAGGELLSRILGSPALDEADADGVWVDAALDGAGGPPAAPVRVRGVAAEHVEAVARGHPVDEQRAGVRVVEGGRVDEDGRVGAVVGPDAVLLPRQRHPEADLGARPEHGLRRRRALGHGGRGQGGQAQPLAGRLRGARAHRHGGAPHGELAAHAARQLPVRQPAPLRVPTSSRDATCAHQTNSSHLNLVFHHENSSLRFDQIFFLFIFFFALSRERFSHLKMKNILGEKKSCFKESITEPLQAKINSEIKKTLLYVFIRFPLPFFPP